MKPKFKTIRDGLEIIDPIEHCRCQLTTNTPVTPTPVNNDRMPYPVDSTVEITTDKLTLQYNTGVFVRNSDRTLVTELQLNEQTVLPRAEYILDISDGFKLYIRVTAKVRITVSGEKVEIEFEESSLMTISARSHHTRPAETITVTDDPTDIMNAVSMFGSALKTTGTERSYPTLRGHPPAITLGAELNIPDSLSRPATGIRIEVPPSLRHVFVVAPLAYYLGAAVVPGSTPKLVTDSGFSYELSGPDGFESAVEQILKQVLLLDCIVRTEGSTPLQLHERQEIGDSLQFAIPEIYNQSIAKRLEAYLEVPFKTLRSQIPQLRIETQFKPAAEFVEFLPFVVNYLSIISVTDNDKRLTSISEEVKRDPSQITKPTVQQFWGHNDQTEIKSTRTSSSFRNAITQTPRDGPLKIEVICNDVNMGKELVNVYTSYENRDDMPLDITVHHNLSKSDLRTVLSKESDFVHYIGHISGDGFQCSDGTMDSKNIETVGAKAFFLNACQSYEQGIGLIEAGSVGGIVTLTDIPNTTAVEAGCTIAQLLNAGLPLYAVLHTLQKLEDFEELYYILGEGKLAVSQTKNGGPMTTNINIKKYAFGLSIETYVSSSSDIGGINIPHIENMSSYYIMPNKIDVPSIPKSQLVEFLNTGEFPVLLEGKLRWSNEIKTSEL